MSLDDPHDFGPLTGDQANMAIFSKGEDGERAGGGRGLW